jgi:hypothetical protein
MNPSGTTINQAQHFSPVPQGEKQFKVKTSAQKIMAAIFLGH